MYTNAYTSLHSLARRRCQRYLHGSLNGMRPFSFLDPNFFPYISISRCCKGATEMSTEPTSLTERYATFFIFRSKFFPPISQFLDAVQARRRCQRNLQGALNGMQPFSFLDPNFFAPISQFLDAAQARRRCQRHLQGALNSMRFLTFLDPNYPPNISISRCGTGATEMSTAPTRCPQQYATIFIFRSFFFSISRILDVAWGLRGSERQPTLRPEQYGIIFIFRSKFFFNISNSGCCTDAMEVSTAPSRRPFSCFCAKNFFFDISNSGCSTGATEESTALTLRPGTVWDHFYFSVQKYFFL